jgi:hypothetical protein
MMRTLRCRVEELASWHPWFYVEPQVAAFVAVVDSYGRTPALFEVDCFNVESPWLGQDKHFRLEVSWSARTAEKAQRLRATMQAKPLVEMAATALALVVVHHILQLGKLDASLYGDRTDYRSTRNSCMLEISGTESRRELARRHRQKIAQALSNPLGWDAYVVVCAFSSRGHQVRFSFHRAKGTCQ